MTGYHIAATTEAGSVAATATRLSNPIQIAFSFLFIGSRGGCIKEGDKMSLKPLMTAALVAVTISGTASIVATPARAQDAVEAEMIGFHRLCEQGDRKACIRFGILIGRNEQRHADWRRAHADWWWWER
jgi:hypothetical protein